MGRRPYGYRRRHGSNEGTLPQVTNSCCFFRIIISPTTQLKKM
ncbi:hypothetical protein KSS87_002282, partial [Heliosperma pusillum]